MKVYVDTNILVASCVAAHPQHAQSFEVMTRIRKGDLQGCVSSHSLAELYSVLTRTPFRPRIHPAEAGRFLEEGIFPFFEVVSWTDEDYRLTLRASANLSLIGGAAYDALHLCAARKANCERLYTLNIKDFRALAPAEWHDKITSP